MERSRLLLVRLVHLRPVHEEQLGHLHRPVLRGEEQWRETIVPRQVRIGTVLEEDLGDPKELLEGGLNQRGGSVIRGRPVHLNPTPIGRPLQQSPRRVHLPAVRSNPQRGFGHPPPNLAGAHKTVRVKPCVGDVEELELRQGRQDVNPSMQSETRLDVQRDELLQVTQRLNAALQCHAPGQEEFAELAKVLQLRRGCRQTPHTCPRRDIPECRQGKRKARALRLRWPRCTTSRCAAVAGSNAGCPAERSATPLMMGPGRPSATCSSPASSRQRTSP